MIRLLREPSIKRGTVLNREIYIIGITNRLAELSRRLQVRNSLNLVDLSVHSEAFYKRVLNLIYGWNLISSNTAQPNADTIDLEDPLQRVAIQVTAQSSLSKVRDATASFERKAHYQRFNKFVVLRIGHNPETKPEKIPLGGGLQFCTKQDIWDVTTLGRVLLDRDVEVLKDLHNYLEAEFDGKVSPTVASEMRTFFRIIEVMSEAVDNEAASDFTEKPDPQGKIARRFAANESKFLEEYVTGMAEYKPALDRAKVDLHVGSIRERRLGRHLRYWSDNVLGDFEGDAVAALRHLCAEIEKRISEQGVSFDIGAIRYYLLDQLVVCNVFPEREVADAPIIL